MNEKTEMLTVRVSKGTKAKIKKAKIHISEEVRNLIESKINAITLLENYKEIEKRAKKRKVSGNSNILIRIDRDSR